jgi:hypothetical protein
MRNTRVSVPFLLSFVAVGLTPGCGQDAQESEEEALAPAAAVQIDHVIVAIGDLQVGMDRFEEMTGVRPVLGGEHPGRGTRNGLVSLGPRLYLELLAPQEGAELPEDAAGLSELTELTPWGWAASTDDIDATLAHLTEAGYTTMLPEAGSRATPDGGLLRWRAGGVAEPLIRGAPFFIEWAEGSPHPATTSPQGCELGVFTIYSPDAEALERFRSLVSVGVDVVATEDPQERFELTLRCPAGQVVIR